MDNLQLKKLHAAQLEIALEVKEICDKNNIKYFMIAGTLLGAVRHKGFIPWDDDLDIGMLRKDYAKFIEIATRDLHDKYYLETWQLSSGYGLPYAKIKMNGTKCLESNSKDVNCHYGIFIDIFPFDNVPSNKIRRLTHEYRTKIFQYLILEFCMYDTPTEFKGFKGFAYNLFKKSMKCLSINEIKEKFEVISKKYNDIRTENVVAVGGSYGYKKETIKLTWITQLADLEFEGYIFKAPKEYKEYLSYFYGEYMTPPPLEERYNRHDIIEIKFEGE